MVLVLLVLGRQRIGLIQAVNSCEVSSRWKYSRQECQKVFMDHGRTVRSLPGRFQLPGEGGRVNILAPFAMTYPQRRLGQRDLELS